MNRDHRKLKAFQLADELVVLVYALRLPPEEKYGMQSQLRRAAVSVPTNIVEGCTRTSLKDYVRFLEIALGSACEVRYLLSVAKRVGLIDDGALEERYDELSRIMVGLVHSLSNLSPNA